MVRFKDTDISRSSSWTDWLPSTCENLGELNLTKEHSSWNFRCQKTGSFWKMIILGAKKDQPYHPWSKTKRPARIQTCGSYHWSTLRDRMATNKYQRVHCKVYINWHNQAMTKLWPSYNQAITINCYAWWHHQIHRGLPPRCHAPRGALRCRSCGQRKLGCTRSRGCTKSSKSAAMVKPSRL